MSVFQISMLAIYQVYRLAIEISCARLVESELDTLPSLVFSKPYSVAKLLKTHPRESDTKKHALKRDARFTVSASNSMLNGIRIHFKFSHLDLLVRIRETRCQHCEHRQPVSFEATQRPWNGEETYHTPSLSSRCRRHVLSPMPSRRGRYLPAAYALSTRLCPGGGLRSMKGVVTRARG